jgi:hypothetical protein
MQTSLRLLRRIVELSRYDLTRLAHRFDRRLTR